MDPTKRVIGDPELPGPIGDDNRAAHQSMMTDRCSSHSLCDPNIFSGWVESFSIKEGST
ncbi:hypothetical protein FHS20_004044 [Phyllobacterium endophyticum]|uniref:hypothetical protein n=1 Tax=Phyllobacterium endophyticum TaxID=1149773 RepID=UPI00147557A9|nr:hypothetical protein [Phyllobacterium endophyticum]MBB3237147.1 hypothetical protein [Phyllobacterium endophyticum]